MNEEKIMGLEIIYPRFYSALLAGDRVRCADEVFGLLEKGMATETLYTDVFQRALYRIGELWEQNKISVATEHLATAVTEHLLSVVYPRILANRAPNGKRVVISCTVNEYHQVGARMVADIMESMGWDVWFLGANTPVNDLLALIQEKQPDVLGLSVSIYFNMTSLVRTVDMVRSHYPGLDIVVGGQAFRRVGTETVKGLEKTILIPSLTAVKQIFRQEARL
jgi:MerR family transcriptional regulator, light-induced transcriptional regulator